MDSSQVVRDALLPNTWATSVDWSDAYHHVPVHPNYVYFLAFQYAGVCFRYVCCPLRLSLLPQAFTEICLPLKAYVRDMWRIHVFQYLDDWLFASASASLTATVTRWFVRLCVDLGLGVNLEKSCLAASRRLVHLGVEWDFKRACARNPIPRTEEVRALAVRVASATLTPLPTLESLLVKLVSLENWRCTDVSTSAAFRGPSYLNCTLVAFSDARADLQWWSDARRLQTWTPVGLPKPDLVVHTDASILGWGACFADQDGSWEVVADGETFSHQLSGDASCSPGVASLRCSISRSVSAVLHR